MWVVVVYRQRNGWHHEANAAVVALFLSHLKGPNSRPYSSIPAFQYNCCAVCKASETTKLSALFDDLWVPESWHWGRFGRHFVTFGCPFELSSWGRALGPFGSFLSMGSNFEGGKKGSHHFGDPLGIPNLKSRNTSKKTVSAKQCPQCCAIDAGAYSATCGPMFGILCNTIILYGGICHRMWESVGPHVYLVRLFRHDTALVLCVVLCGSN